MQSSTYFEIYGDDEVLLEAFNRYSEAKRWVDNYTRRGDFGGYSVIAVWQADEIVYQVVDTSGDEG